MNFQENDEVTAMMEPERDDPEENEAPLFQGLGSCRSICLR